MKEQIFALAKLLGKVDESEEPALTQMCGLACETLAGRLRPGVMADDCALSFVTAGAWMALAALWSGGGEAASFTAGDLTIRREASRAEQGDGLLARAQRLMAPWLEDGTFSFRSVRGI
ncbi:MAG: hypothetical protein GX585_03715 [Clostridiales bacterium]|nr:hypothetical protein [Clostridiales bacterium]